MRLAGRRVMANLPRPTRRLLPQRRRAGEREGRERAGREGREGSARAAQRPPPPAPAQLGCRPPPRGQAEAAGSPQALPAGSRRPLRAGVPAEKSVCVGGDDPPATARAAALSAGVNCPCPSPPREPGAAFSLPREPEEDGPCTVDTDTALRSRSPF